MRRLENCDGIDIEKIYVFFVWKKQYVLVYDEYNKKKIWVNPKHNNDLYNFGISFETSIETMLSYIKSIGTGSVWEFNNATDYCENSGNAKRRSSKTLSRFDLLRID